MYSIFGGNEFQISTTQLYTYYDYVIYNHIIGTTVIIFLRDVGS